MKPNTHYIPLKISPHFNNASFDEQLLSIEMHIRTICQQLRKAKDQSEEWIIVWREYGITDGSQRYITATQKKQVKEVMQQLTEDYYPKLKIVSGTVGTQRLITKQNPKWDQKVNDIICAYKNNPHFFPAVGIFLENNKDNLLRDSFILVRNTAYVFYAGECVERRDKRKPFNETALIPNSICRPGPGKKIQINPIDFKFAIEICYEHAEGVLAKEIPVVLLPLVQLILSASTFLLPEHAVSRYVIHIDSRDPIVVLTEIPKENLEVIVSSYDMETKQLTVVEPKTRRTFVLDYLQNGLSLTESNMVNYGDVFFRRLLLNHQKQHILNAADYIFILDCFFKKNETVARRFAAIVLTLLNQNKTCELSRDVYFRQYLMAFLHQRAKKENIPSRKAMLMHSFLENNKLKKPKTDAFIRREEPVKIVSRPNFK